MTLEDLERRLAEGARRTAPRSSACPDEHLIAGYVDGALDAPQLRQLDAHLADCGYCLGLVAMLCRERDAAREGYGTDPVQAPAGKVISPPRRWHRAPQWAAAAALVLAVPLLLQIGRNADRAVDRLDGAALSGTRNIGSGSLELRFVPAGRGPAPDASPPSLAWAEVAGTPYYDVRIVSDEGDVVAQDRVAGTQWQFPEELQLRRGAEYYALVEAYPAGGKAVSSEHVPFRVPE